MDSPWLYDSKELVALIKLRNGHANLRRSVVPSKTSTIGNLALRFLRLMSMTCIAEGKGTYQSAIYLGRWMTLIYLDAPAIDTRASISALSVMRESALQNEHCHERDVSRPLTPGALVMLQ